MKATVNGLETYYEIHGQENDEKLPGNVQVPVHVGGIPEIFYSHGG